MRPNKLGQSNSSSWISKANHSHIIRDEFIQDFLKGCRFPEKPGEDLQETNQIITDIVGKVDGTKHILTVDGSYITVDVKKEYPSSTVAFFQFGAILFTTDDLKNLSQAPFIFPEDMNKFHNLQKIKLVLPIKNVISCHQNSLNRSVRKAIYEFFMRDVSNDVTLMQTLAWIIFEEYTETKNESYTLSSNPNLGSGLGNIILRKSEMKKDFTFEVDGDVVYLTDIFRLHEAIDEELGAGGILGYVCRLIEQMILVRYIKVIYGLKSDALRDFCFISNGPLSFSGQTANMHKPFRKLCNFMLKKHNLCLFGLETKGAFIDHALSICQISDSGFRLGKGKCLILSNDYIYSYITPGDSASMHYGSTSYYGGKVIVHTDDGQVFVVSVPVENKDVILSPTQQDYPNLDTVVGIIKLLKCEMYEDTIVPVALANKLISLTNHPSQKILETFAKKFV